MIEKINQVINLTVRFVSSHCISHKRMKEQAEHYSTDRYKKAVPKGAPEIGQLHSLCKVA